MPLETRASSTLYNTRVLADKPSGGSVAKLLLQYPEQYTVRCLTRDPESKQALALAASGAELVKGNLTEPSTLPPAVEGCWGVFAVTNFYDAVRCSRFPMVFE